MESTTQERRVPKQRKLVSVETGRAPHYKTEADRRKAAAALAVDQAADITRHVNLVPVQVYTHQDVERPARTPRQAAPIVLVDSTHRKTPEAFALHVIAMQAVNPKGFRQPSDKAKNWRSTSLAEKSSIAAGVMSPNAFERSRRGQKEFIAEYQYRALVVLDQLLEQNPREAALAAMQKELRPLIVDMLLTVRRNTVTREWAEAQVDDRLDRFCALYHQRYAKAVERGLIPAELQEAA